VLKRRCGYRSARAPPRNEYRVSSTHDDGEAVSSAVDVGAASAGACSPDIEQVECYTNADCTGLGVCNAGRCEVDPNAERSDVSPGESRDAVLDPATPDAAPSADAAPPADAASDAAPPRCGPETVPPAPAAPSAPGSVTAPVRLIEGIFEDGPMLSLLAPEVFLMVKAVDDQVYAVRIERDPAPDGEVPWRVVYDVPVRQGAAPGDRALSARVLPLTDRGQAVVAWTTEAAEAEDERRVQVQTIDTGDGSPLSALEDTLLGPDAEEAGCSDFDAYEPLLFYSDGAPVLVWTESQCGQLWTSTSTDGADGPAFRPGVRWDFGARPAAAFGQMRESVLAFAQWTPEAGDTDLFGRVFVPNPAQISAPAPFARQCGDVAWTAGAAGGTTDAFAWIDGRDEDWEVYLTVVGANAGAQVGDVRVSTGAVFPDALSVVWLDALSQYAVLWSEDRDGGSARYALVDETGAITGGDALFADLPGGIALISAVATGRTISATMVVQSGDYPGVYFSQVVLPEP